MSSVADELITKYTLKDEYSAGLAKIGRNSQNAAKQINSAKDAVGGKSGGGLMGAFSALKGGITPVTAAITAVVAGITAVVGAGAGLIALAKTSMEAFAPYDTLTRTFEGIYGSAGKAKQMMGFLNSEAQKSNFLFTDLAQNAKLLALQGMKWSDYSDAIQALAIRGGGSSEALGMATSTVTRIKGGDYGEAFENLRSMGYSRDVLTQMGLVFDKSGSYKGSMEQALAVVRKIGTENKAIVDAMNGGAEATIGNVTESFGLALADIGKQAFSTLKPFLENLASAMGDAINSGAIRDTVSAVMDMLNMGDGEVNLTKVIASVLAGVETAAAYVRMIFETIKSILNSPIVKGILSLFGMGKLGGFGGAMFNGDLSKIYDNAYARNVARMDAYHKKAAKSGAVAEPDNPNAKATATPLQAIADNTKETAKNTKAQADMSRHVFGGGDVGRVGLTPLEIRRANRAQASSNVTVKIVGGSLEDMLRSAVMQAVAQMKRQGALA